MRSDDLVRALVPILLKKGDKLQRGCFHRPGGAADAAETSGLNQLGFLMGGLLQSPEIQKSFGICRQAAKESRVPLISDFLPKFFCPTESDLIEGSSLAVSLLQKDGTVRDYMVCRDEVVYAKTFSMIYGMSSLFFALHLLISLCHIYIPTS